MEVGIDQKECGDKGNLRVICVSSRLRGSGKDKTTVGVRYMVLLILALGLPVALISP